MEKVDKRLECRRCYDEAKAEANEEDGGAGWLIIMLEVVLPPSTLGR